MSITEFVLFAYCSPELKLGACTMRITVAAFLFLCLGLSSFYIEGTSKLSTRKDKRQVTLPVFTSAIIIITLRRFFGDRLLIIELCASCYVYEPRAPNIQPQH